MDGMQCNRPKGPASDTTSVGLCQCGCGSDDELEWFQVNCSNCKGRTQELIMGVLVWAPVGFGLVLFDRWIQRFS
jgi:hypothetical protein